MDKISLAYCVSTFPYEYLSIALYFFFCDRYVTYNIVRDVCYRHSAALRNVRKYPFIRRIMIMVITIYTYTCTSDILIQS